MPAPAYSAMNDGHWLSLDDENGATIAVVCSVDERGTETLISECGRRLLRRGPGSFVDIDSGRHYREHQPRAPRDPPDNGPYAVVVQERSGYLQVDIRGDFRRSSAVHEPWRQAIAQMSVSRTRRLLIVREAGRVEDASAMIDHLHRLFGALRGDARVAIVAPSEAGPSALMWLSLARLPGLAFSVFSDRGEAIGWLPA